MQGVAYTVFEGVNPEPMEVEILGVLKDALGPGQDMILARLHGDEAGVYGRGGGDEWKPGVYRRAAGGGAELPDWAVQQGADCGDYSDRVDAAGAGWRWSRAVAVRRAAAARAEQESARAKLVGWSEAAAGGAGDGDAAGVWRVQPGDGGAVWRPVPGDGADAGGGAGRGGSDGGAAGAAGAGSRR